MTIVKQVKETVRSRPVSAHIGRAVPAVKGFVVVAMLVLYKHFGAVFSAVSAKICSFQRFMVVL